MKRPGGDERGVMFLFFCMGNDGRPIVAAHFTIIARVCCITTPQQEQKANSRQPFS
jgi:hypothetical protein